MVELNALSVLVDLVLAFFEAGPCNKDDNMFGLNVFFFFG